jgi:HD-GYP domain-containing protein (c-di-GMP phosphodiesterase class II)
VSAGTSELENAFLGAASHGRIQTPVLVQMLPLGAWMIETPVRDEDGENGTMILAGMPTTSFRPDAAVVLALADMVQAVVANGRAHLDALRLGRERDIHIDVAHAMAGSEPLRDRLSTVTKMIAEFVGATAVSIEELRTSNRSLTYNMTSGASPRFLERWDSVRTSEEGLAFVRSIAEEAPCILDDPAHDPRVPEEERALLARAGVRTSSICPIRLDGQLLGILAAVSTTPDFFNEDIVAMLMTITDHLAPAISVALLRDELELSYVQLEQASREALARLAFAAEARDPHTGGHLRRIRHYSVALALEAGLDADEAEAIGAASTIHDLGKLSLSDEVLLKPGKLTPGDWDQMREHPGQGERLIGDSPKFELERAVTRWHHERWDGTGYPDGLSGEETPLAARIVAVADAFDALTTDRPYKRAWLLDEACDEVLRMRGRLFCPRVVDALEALRRSGRLARMFAEVQGREHEAPRPRAAA